MHRETYRKRLHARDSHDTKILKAAREELLAGLAHTEGRRNDDKTLAETNVRVTSNDRHYAQES